MDLDDLLVHAFCFIDGRIVAEKVEVPSQSHIATK